MAKDLKKTTADFKALAKGAGRLLRGPGKFLLWVRTSGSSLALQHLSHQNVLMQDLTPMVFDNRRRSNRLRFPDTIPLHHHNL